LKSCEIFLGCFKIAAVVDDTNDIWWSFDAAVEIRNKSFAHGITCDQDYFGG